jgi:hypothetical protein
VRQGARHQQSLSGLKVDRPGFQQNKKALVWLEKYSNIDSAASVCQNNIARMPKFSGDWMK